MYTASLPGSRPPVYGGIQTAPEFEPQFAAVLSRSENHCVFQCCNSRPRTAAHVFVLSCILQRPPVLAHDIRPDPLLHFPPDIQQTSSGRSAQPFVASCRIRVDS